MANKNPLEKMEQFYDECVEKEDKKGFADVYKQATESLFLQLKDALGKNGIDIHFEDVEYLDGYFIFAYGTNSVVHFHIKEAPGWKFGIWWTPIKSKNKKGGYMATYRKDRLACEFFFQYEEEIDKFKPSASTYQHSFEFSLGVKRDKPDYLDWLNLYKDIEFLIKEPYLAFYKEMHYTNFNHEHVSRAKAKRYWDRHRKEKAEEKAANKENAKEMFEAVKKIVSEIAEEGKCFIVDYGTSIDPRYEIAVKNEGEDGKPFGEEGTYDIAEFDWAGEKADAIWKKADKSCAKRSKYAYLFNPFSRYCALLDPKRYDEAFKKAKDGDYLLYGRAAEGVMIENEAKPLFE